MKPDARNYTVRMEWRKWSRLLQLAGPFFHALSQFIITISEECVTCRFFQFAPAVSASNFFPLMCTPGFNPESGVLHSLLLAAVRPELHS